MIISIHSATLCLSFRVLGCGPEGAGRLCYSVRISWGQLARGELFSQNWYPKVASLHALDDAELQHLHDFLHGGARLQRIFDVTPSTWRVHVGERCIERNAQELDFLGRHDAATV